jgi:hypothetical protein
MDALEILMWGCVGVALFIAGMLFEHGLTEREARRRREHLRKAFEARWGEREDEEGS